MTRTEQFKFVILVPNRKTDVDVYGLFDSYGEAYGYAHENKFGVTGVDFMIRRLKGVE